jgi:hypothetical protein
VLGLPGPDTVRDLLGDAILNVSNAIVMRCQPRMNIRRMVSVCADLFGERATRCVRKLTIDVCALPAVGKAMEKRDASYRYKYGSVGRMRGDRTIIGAPDPGRFARGWRTVTVFSFGCFSSACFFRRIPKVFSKNLRAGTIDVNVAEETFRFLGHFEFLKFSNTTSRPLFFEPHRILGSKLRQYHD